MAIQAVNQESCVGCGLCIKACPMDVFRIQERKAIARYPEECMCCAACEDVCPTHSLYVSPEKPERLMVSWR